MKKLFITLLFLMLSVGVAFGGNLKDRGDQDVYGSLTFFKDQTFKGDVDVDGIINGVVNASTGKVFFVGPTSASDTSRYGTKKSQPFATLDYAIGQCSSGRGDFIIILPGHNESLGTGETVVIDVDGISIIGIGSGESMQPTFDFDIVATTFNVQADDILIENLWFRASISAASGVDLDDESSGITIRNCKFSSELNDSSDEFANAISAGESINHLTIEGCVFDAGIQAAVASIYLREDSKNVTIRNNVFWGDASIAHINNKNYACQRLLIDSNIIVNGEGIAGNLNAQPCIEVLATTGGVVCNNFLAAEVTSDTVVVGDDMLMFQNYYTMQEGGDKTAGLAGASNIAD